MINEIKINTVTTLENGLRVKLIRGDSVPAAETFLSGGELAKLASFKIEKRRREWAGGRYAAKTLVKEFFNPETQLSAIEITYDLFGRPMLADGKCQRLISITHSGPFCAAACGPAGTTFIGIDLEKAEPRAGAWYRDYFHKSELINSAAVRQQESTAGPEEANIDTPFTANHYPLVTIQLATLRWTQKEALLKALGIGLKADLLDINLTGDTPEFTRAALTRYAELGKPPYSLATFEPEPGWYLSIVCQTPPNLLK